ncbi:hypothetical protein C2G38_2184006 [Gigaspora rosea]|uniref:Uncharacterized protein n=1 Tax=Gigaspora rosea TaxID=44941 RepID=A0A397V9B1_9GLOM|nr:hypothetical protein C2G38_2184006 [Gigaspora rosea]
MFSVTDTNTSHKVQIAEDIASFLRQTYFQRYHPSLGRVHEHSNCMAVIRNSNQLSQDFTQLLENVYYYNVVIEVGDQPISNFLSHIQQSCIYRWGEITPLNKKFLLKLLKLFDGEIGEISFLILKINLNYVKN